MLSCCAWLGIVVALDPNAALLSIISGSARCDKNVHYFGNSPMLQNFRDQPDVRNVPLSALTNGSPQRQITKFQSHA